MILYFDQSLQAYSFFKKFFYLTLHNIWKNMLLLLLVYQYNYGSLISFTRYTNWAALLTLFKSCVNTTLHKSIVAQYHLEILVEHYPIMIMQ